MEDILEEIVGEIRDEFDDDEINDIVKLEEDIYQINGRVLLDDLHEKFDITFEDSEDIDTIGGWLQAHNTNLQVEDYIDTNTIDGLFLKWIITNWYGFKYQFNETRPVISDEEEEDNHDHKHESDE